jgi:uncharacterized protein
MTVPAIDTMDLPVVDAHCHPFRAPDNLAGDELRDRVSFAGSSPGYFEAGGVTADDDLLRELGAIRQNAVYLRYLIRQLADFFGCEATIEEVAEARNEALRDYRGYVRKLFTACGLAALVPDFGYPQPQVDIAAFSADMPVPIAPVFRIEPLIAQLLEKGLGWDEFAQGYDESVSNALGREGYRGLKTIIAYRTGLDISLVSRTRDQGLLAFDGVRRGTGNESMKKLRDHLLCRALEICIEYDVPMQIHTGMGDFEVNLVLCRPSLLMDLLRFPPLRACRVVLVHSGFPYHSEAAYMAAVLPRVYCDVSEGIPFAGHAAKRIFTEIMELAPLSKIMYGSDGFNMPEINYASAILGKRALSGALGELVDEGFLSRAEAREAARWILSETACKLYRLDC